MQRGTSDLGAYRNNYPLSIEKALRFNKIFSIFACESMSDNMKTTAFNPVQIHLLRMFEYDNSSQSLEELKDVLYRYYSKRLDAKLDELWDNGILDQKRLDEISKMDLHQLDK